MPNKAKKGSKTIAMADKRPVILSNSTQKETGTVIIETIKERGVDPNHMPAVLVNSHGPFAWGTSPANCVHNAVVLEELAKMAFNTEKLNMEINRMQGELLDKHFYRKHGKDAYYGQN